MAQSDLSSSVRLKLTVLWWNSQDVILKPLGVFSRSCAGLCCSACPSESGLKIGFGWSCGCSPELNLLPCSRAQPWIHFTEAGIAVPSCEESVMGFPALLPRCCCCPCSLLCLLRAEEIKTELGERWGAREDHEEGRQSSRNLSVSTHWDLNCNCAALRCLDHWHF